MTNNVHQTDNSSLKDFPQAQTYNENPQTRWSNFFSLKGRISRRTYWTNYFIIWGITFVLLMLEQALFFDYPTTGSMSWTWLLLSNITAYTALYISIAIGVKRTHDRNRSGWFLLVSLIPILGALWLLVELGFFKGTTGDNRFGPEPLF